LPPEGVVNHAGRLAAEDEVYGPLWFTGASFLGGLLDLVRCAESTPSYPVVFHDPLEAFLDL
jgi:hypothetical protein